MNSNGTTYQNGRFVDVDEVHNNTKNMTLSGFNQEGGTVTGNIENLKIESKQNTSVTKGSSYSGSVDSYDKATKTAISVKSIDMTSKIYIDGSGLSSKLNSDLKAIKDFTEYKLKTVKLENKDIENRILKIVINNEPLNKSQIENLKKFIEDANKSGIKVEAVILK